MTVELLTRATAMPKNISPLGHRFAIFHLNPDTSLCTVSAVRVDEEGRDVPDGTAILPTELSGRFTGASRAQEAIRKYLDKMWMKTEEQIAKNAKKRGTKVDPAQEDVIGAAAAG
jgi:hypothetical protein